jgi:ATP-dependent DNA helicase RecG
MFDSVEELVKKIRLGEDNSIELKAVTFKGDRVEGPSRNALADEIGAIANTHDAVIVLGVDDRTKDIVGIPVDKLDIVEDFVRDICNESIEPPVKVRTFRIELPDASGEMKPVLKVEIPKSLYVHNSPGGYFHRQGSLKREMRLEYLARLFQQRSQAQIIRFDEQSIPGTSFETLSEELWKRFTTRSDEPDEIVLQKRNLLIEDEDGSIHASVAGILLCSEHPEDHMPNTLIEAVRYRGIEQDSNYQLDAQRITGPLDRQIDNAMAFYRKNQTVAAIKTPARIEIPQFDDRAVFEALVNAVAHRDYSVYGSKIRFFMFDDRMEIYSPGPLPNTVSVETIMLRQVTRNELITSLLAECSFHDDVSERRSYMEKRGDGVSMILSLSEELSEQKPTYLQIDNAELLLTIYAAKPPEQ